MGDGEEAARGQGLHQGGDDRVRVGLIGDHVQYPQQHEGHGLGEVQRPRRPGQRVPGIAQVGFDVVA